MCDQRDYPRMAHLISYTNACLFFFFFSLLIQDRAECQMGEWSRVCTGMSEGYRLGIYIPC